MIAVLEKSTEQALILSLLSRIKRDGELVENTLSTANRPIPRLYTAEEFGTFFGFLCPGGSNLPEAIASGRIAGKSTAAEKPGA